MTVRTGNCQAAVRANFADDLEIPPAQSAGNETDLEAASVRLLHDLEPRPVAPIEYRNTSGNA